MFELPTLWLAEIATSPGPLRERAFSMLTELRRQIPLDAAWIELAAPQESGYTWLAGTVSPPAHPQGSTGLGVTRYLSWPGDRGEHPLVTSSTSSSPLEAAGPTEDLRLRAQRIGAAGLTSLTVPLGVPGPRHVGRMTLVSACARPLTNAQQRHLRDLSPILARGIDPLRSALAAAQVVRGVEAGFVVYRSGGTVSLPGLLHDALLCDGSGLLEAARATLTGDQLCTRFLWPRGGRHAPDGYARVTVLAGAEDSSGLLLGMVLLSPAGELRGLTPRELEVVGLLVEGCANHEIARALVVAPRTVATHVEHILDKLDAPSRTLAAVRAARAGCYVPTASWARDEARGRRR